MVCARHPERQAERLCARCRAAACGACLRRAGFHVYCGDDCVLIALMERASAAAFALAARASRRSRHTPLSRLRLAPYGAAARRAQARLDAYLDVLEAERRGARRHRPPALRWTAARAAIPLAAAAVAASAAAVAFVPRNRHVAAPSHAAPVAPAERSAAVPSAPAAAPPTSTPPPAAGPEAPPVAAIPTARVPAPRPAPARLRERPARPAAGFVEDLSRGSLEVRQVALTFDADSEASGAEAILEALRTRGLRSTMFLTAGYIRKYPELVRRIVADGHEVGNHTKTHPHLTSYAQDGRQATLPHVTREFLRAELRAAEEAFRQVAGRPLAPLWRAPFGEHNAEIRAWAAEAGYRHVGWTRDAASREDLDTRDWVADPASPMYRSSREIRERVLRFGAGNGHGLNGGIILMHLGTQRRRDPAHARLPEILEALAAGGYRLVTVSELLGEAPGTAEVAHLVPGRPTRFPPEFPLPATIPDSP